MKSRTFLFLQGPASPFLRLLAEAIEKKGASVKKIGVCLGDLVFWWPRESDFFRDRNDKWPAYLECYIRDHNITDIVMLGDGRRTHAAAADIGIRGGLRVHILEHGYLRPDWLTVEPDGMSAHSRFPQEPREIEALAAGKPAVPSGSLYRSSFLTYALYDLAFHIPNVVLGWLVHPHYRTHGPVHPLVEYSGWIRKGLTAGKRRREAEKAVAAALAPSPDGNANFFLFPLQLPGDYQIRRHAPGGDLFRLADAAIASFARHAPAGSRLLFKVHPIDNGLSRWSDRIGKTARRHGVAGRVFVADGGDTDALIQKSRGVVTVNSTVGLTALAAGKPVIALGSAIYDVPGLTFQESLAAFWQRPSAPDPALFDAFMRALAATTQVRGGFIGREAISAGVEHVAERLMETEDRLPLAFRKPRDPVSFRYEKELFSGINPR
ncbi:capsular polysaccharide export protein [Xaviernesmea oryzae]|uniref:Capsular polysaccharide export protein n=1 Tax=Xaviernesmea oryzae TaxID=464029 RepID=A0A1X7FFX9_9HYPH|nr:capsular biosynthesis protein [Xaviernesmea oryzae]SMF51372.1 capsular polysaccharide export protein [Xaviernesmea oryzae]